jgi:hypothetical protein
VKTAIIDLANPDSVRQSTDQQLGDTRPLDTLINNAGIMAIPKRETSPDGHELQFATNVLGPFRLTGLLLPAILGAAATRVVTVSSYAHNRGGPVPIHDLDSEAGYKPIRAYSKTKLANILFKRPTLRLKRDDLVPAEEDRQIEIATYDLLLPCRRYEITYKVAVLGLATPTLEFLRRLVKAVAGIGEQEVMSFFGFSRRELEYVLDEAIAPGYLERDEGRLWLTTAGENLFSQSEDGPVIFSVEGRRGSYGFDLLAMAPERPKFLDKVEMALPDLRLDDHSATGRASQDRVPNSFRRFFRELGERKDREQIKKLDLYSIDSVTAGERFQVPVRVRLLAQASSPGIAEVDFSDWRPDPDLSERPEVERAAGQFLEELSIATNTEADGSAYQTLVDLAPEFLKEFTTRAGLSVNRYWREAVSRAGEPRSDRKTIPIVGALVNQDNIERLLRLIEYGYPQVGNPPAIILSVPPVVPYWGATSVLRDTISVLRRKLMPEEPPSDDSDLRSICLVVGKPAKYIEQAFDRTETVGRLGHSASLEFLIVPNIAVCVVVHAPIGCSSGLAAPLGFGSFDPDVLDRVQELLLEAAVRNVENEQLRGEIERAFSRPAQLDGPN